MFGGGVEVNDAIFPVAHDDGVADLRQDFPAEAIGFGIQARQRE